MRPSKYKDVKILRIASLFIAIALLAVFFFLVREILRPSPFRAQEVKDKSVTEKAEKRVEGQGDTSQVTQEKTETDPGQDLHVEEETKSDIPRDFLKFRQPVLDEAEKVMPVPYLMQKDGRWSQKQMGASTLGQAGCGPTCMSMVAMSLTRNYELTPDRMAEDLIAGNYYVENIGTKWTYMNEGAEKYGFHGKEIGNQPEAILEELDKGRVLIASLKHGDFTNEGHFIVLTGREGEGIKVQDPNSWQRTHRTWPQDVLFSQIKNTWTYYK